MRKHEILSFIILTVVIISLIFIISGCSLVNQKLDLNKIYKRDISLEINDEIFEGVGVPFSFYSYEIKIKSKGKIDMLQIKSCSRDEHITKTGGGFFKSGKKFTYIYTPLKGLEDNASCALEIGAYEERKGRHSWANIYFQDKDFDLHAKLKCNGNLYSDNKSSSVCQGSVGSIQKIIFNERVKVSPDNSRCKVMKTENELEYTYIIPKGECTFYFGSKDADFHIHTTIGYDGILIRGE